MGGVLATPLFMACTFEMQASTKAEYKEAVPLRDDMTKEVRISPGQNCVGILNLEGYFPTTREMQTPFCQVQ